MALFYSAFNDVLTVTYLIFRRPTFLDLWLFKIPYVEEHLLRMPKRYDEEEKKHAFFKECLRLHGDGWQNDVVAKNLEKIKGRMV